MINIREKDHTPRKIEVARFFLSRDTGLYLRNSLPNLVFPKRRGVSESHKFEIFTTVEYVLYTFRYINRWNQKSSL